MLHLDERKKELYNGLIHSSDLAGSLHVTLCEMSLILGQFVPDGTIFVLRYVIFCNE